MERDDKIIKLWDYMPLEDILLYCRDCAYPSHFLMPPTWDERELQCPECDLVGMLVRHTGKRFN